MTSVEAPPPPPPPPPPKKKPWPGQPWSDQETAALISVYEQRWYAAKRGQLKAHQWEEVAGAIAARLGLHEPSKTGTQCRHKLEKLRKRYRSERNRQAPSRWLFFDRMDRMERGPFPISVRLPPKEGEEEEEESDSEEESEQEDEEVVGGEQGMRKDGNFGFPGVSGNGRLVDYGGEGRAVRELAAAVRSVGEGFVRMEKRRMEMMREMEREWMEMEARRAQMLVESQRYVVASIARAFGGQPNKKPKKVLAPEL